MGFDIQLNDFIQVYDPQKNTYYYGGNQDWFENLLGQWGGCGVVTATNMLLYLVSQKPEYKPLCPSLKSSIITIDAYKEFMEEVIKYMTPIKFWNPFYDYPTWGVWGNKFKKGVITLSEAKGVKLRLVSLEVFASDSKAIEYIKEGLSNGVAIALFQRLSLTGEGYGGHWVTITGISEDSNGNVKVTISNWGKKEILDFIKLWDIKNFTALYRVE